MSVNSISRHRTLNAMSINAIDMMQRKLRRQIRHQIASLIWASIETGNCNSLNADFACEAIWAAAVDIATRYGIDAGYVERTFQILRSCAADNTIEWLMGLREQTWLRLVVHDEEMCWLYESGLYDMPRK